MPKRAQGCHLYLQSVASVQRDQLYVLSAKRAPRCAQPSPPPLRSICTYGLLLVPFGQEALRKRGTHFIHIGSCFFFRRAPPSFYLYKLKTGSYSGLPFGASCTVPYPGRRSHLGRGPFCVVEVPPVRFVLWKMATVCEERPFHPSI